MAKWKVTPDHAHHMAKRNAFGNLVTLLRRLGVADRYHLPAVSNAYYTATARELGLPIHALRTFKL